MRGLAFALLASLLAAGCISQSGAPDPASPAAPAPQPAADSGDIQVSDLAAPGDPTFCSSASNCDFWDEDYHEYVLYDVDTPVIDVLIVPSASLQSAQDTAVMKAAVLAWHTGVDQLAVSWLANAFTMNVYVVGQDAIPESARNDPEIIVLAAEYNPFVLLGIGLEPKQYACQAFGAYSLREYPLHSHDGMDIAAADCAGMGSVCVAANMNFLLGTKNQLYDLVAHEVGHCLGVGHVGDALDFAAKRVPIHDIMSYQEDPAKVHCVSTLNVRVLESLYAPVLGQTVTQPVGPGDYYDMATSQYSQVNCPNP